MSAFYGPKLPDRRKEARQGHHGACPTKAPHASSDLAGQLVSNRVLQQLQEDPSIVLGVVQKDPILRQAAQQDPQLAALLDPDTFSQVLQLIQPEADLVCPSRDQQETLNALSRNRKALARLQNYAQQLLLQKHSNQHIQPNCSADVRTAQGGAEVAAGAGKANGAPPWWSGLGQACSPSHSHNGHKRQADQGSQGAADGAATAVCASQVTSAAATNGGSAQLGQGGGMTDRWEMLKQRMSKYHERTVALATGTLPSKGPLKGSAPVQATAAAAAAQGGPLGLGALGLVGAAAATSEVGTTGSSAGKLQRQGAGVTGIAPASKGRSAQSPVAAIPSAPAAAAAVASRVNHRTSRPDSLTGGIAPQASKGSYHAVASDGASRPQEKQQQDDPRQQQQRAYGFRGPRTNAAVAAVVPNPGNYMSAFAPLQSPLMPMGQFGFAAHSNSSAHSDVVDGSAAGMGVSHDLLQLLSAVPEVAAPAAAAVGTLAQTSQPLSPGLNSSRTSATAGGVQGPSVHPMTSPVTSPSAAADSSKVRWAWGSWFDTALGLAAPTSPPAVEGGGQHHQHPQHLYSSCSDTQAVRLAAGRSLSVRGTAASTHKVLRPHNSSPLPGEHPLSPGAASVGSTHGSIGVGRAGASVVGSPVAGAAAAHMQGLAAGGGLQLGELTVEAVRQRLASGDVVVEIEPPTKLATNLSWSTSPTAEYVLDAGSSGVVPGGSRGSLCSSSNGMPDGRTLGSGPSLRLSIPEEDGDLWGPQLQGSELGSRGVGLELLGALGQCSYDGGMLYDSMREGSSVFSYSTGGGPSAPTSPDRVSEGGGRRRYHTSSSGEPQWGRPASAAAGGGNGATGSTTSNMRERRLTGVLSPRSPAVEESWRPSSAGAQSNGSATPSRRWNVGGQEAQGRASGGGGARHGQNPATPSAAAIAHAAAAAATGAHYGVATAAAAAVGPGVGDLEYYRLMYQQCGVMPGGGVLGAAAAGGGDNTTVQAGLGGEVRLDPKTYYEDVVPSSWRPGGEDNCSALYRRAYCSHGDALFPPLWLAAITLLAASGLLPFSLLLLVSAITLPWGMQLLAVRAAGLKPSQLPGSRVLPSFVASMELLTLGVVLWGLVPAAWLGNAAACMMLVVAVGLTIAFHVRTYALDPGYVPLAAEGDEDGWSGVEQQKNIWGMPGRTDAIYKHHHQQQQQQQEGARGVTRKALGAVSLAGTRGQGSQQQQEELEVEVEVEQPHHQVQSVLDLAPLVDLSGAAAAVEIVPAAGTSSSTSNSRGKGKGVGSPSSKTNRPGGAVAVTVAKRKTMGLATGAAAAGGGAGQGAGAAAQNEISPNAAAAASGDISELSGSQGHPQGRMGGGAEQPGVCGRPVGSRDIDGCWTCGVKRPLRSKHCPYCRRCVERFDHHCHIVGNCIGRGNQRSFTLYLLAMLSAQLLYLYLVPTALMQQCIIPGGMCLHIGAARAPASILGAVPAAGAAAWEGVMPAVAATTTGTTATGGGSSSISSSGGAEGIGLEADLLGSSGSSGVGEGSSSGAWLLLSSLWYGRLERPGWLLLMMFHLMTLCATMYLTLRHLLAVAANLTVNEWVNRRRYIHLQDGHGGYCNRLDGGPLHNCWEFWAAPGGDPWKAWEEGEQALRVDGSSVVTPWSAGSVIRWWDVRYMTFRTRLLESRRQRQETQLARRLAALKLVPHGGGS